MVVEIELNRNLEDFLATKPLYYEQIDTTRMPRAFESIKHCLKLPKIIHIIGTNGKGTTGRFIATALHEAGYRVGHYTSPHIMYFRERIWIDGSEIEEKELEQLHERLLEILPPKFTHSLSYFEYTTFLAMLAFEGYDYAVVEAGLGGEFDATAVFGSVLSVVTPIDKDHEAFLGDSIEQIATTKLNAVKKVALLAKQPHKEVYEIAEKLAQKKGFDLFYAQEIAKDKVQSILSFAHEYRLVAHLADNLITAVAALELLGIEYDMASFRNAKLFGRMSQIAKNIIVDVGHNPLAAHAIAQSLTPNRYVLVYNSFQDKDYTNILRMLKPVVKRVEIIGIEDERIANKEDVVASAKNLGMAVDDFVCIKEDERYLVFGSFRVVETFLKSYHG